MGLFDVFTGTKRPASGTTPQPQHEVHNALLALNRPDAPFLIRDGSPENVDLVCEWRILDPEWYAYFEAVGMHRTFQVHMKFDANKSELRSVDKQWLLEWANGIPNALPSTEYGRGQINQKERRFRFERDESGKLRKVNEDTFSAQELKAPIRDVVTSMGWTWRGITFGRL